MYRAYLKLPIYVDGHQMAAALAALMDAAFHCCEHALKCMLVMQLICAWCLARFALHHIGGKQAADR